MTLLCSEPSPTLSCNENTTSADKELICSLIKMFFGIFQHVLCYYKAGDNRDRAMLCLQDTHSLTEVSE